MAARTAHIFEEKWRSKDVMLQEEADFSSLLLSENVLNGLEKAGYKKPSPIQLQAIPSGRFGQDLVVQAKSGTGKTLVFSIIALEMLLPIRQTQVIILAPTREIAFQICSVIQTLGSEFLDLKCCVFIGGTPFQEDKEKAQSCQIAVGTPGRLGQLVQMKFLKTNSVRLLVLDEADQLLDKSFQSAVDMIFKSLPTEKQVIATSATYPKKLKKLVNRYFREPFIARLNENKLSLLGMAHYTYFIKNAHMALLAYKLKLSILEEILSTVKFSQCLIFCNLISRVEPLCISIKKWGFSTTYISSAKEQSARLKAIESLKHFKCKVLVSSDVTSRGIDAENVDLVINFDVPQYTEIYLHRVGRAGRYGSKGVAITFLTDKDVTVFKTIENEGNFKTFILPDPIPENLINVRPEASLIENSTEESSTDDSTDEGNDIQNGNYSFGSKEENILSYRKSSDDNIIQIDIDDLNDNAVNNIENTSENGITTHNLPMEKVEKNYVKKDCSVSNSVIQTVDLNDHENSEVGSKSVDGKNDQNETIPTYSVESSISELKISCNELELEKSHNIECALTTKQIQNGFSADVDVKSKYNLDSENLKNIYAPISNFITLHEKSKKGNNVVITESERFNCGNKLDSQIKVHNDGAQSSDKKAINAEDIAHLKDSLHEFYYSIFKSFNEEHIPKNFCEVVEENASENKTLGENDQSDVFIGNKNTNENIKVESHSSSVAKFGIQKPNEDDNNLGTTNESIKQIYKTVLNSAEEKSKIVISSTPKSHEITKGQFYTSIQLSSDSSDEELPNTRSRNVLMLHKALEKAKKYKKQSHQGEVLSKKDSINNDKKQTDPLSSQSSLSTFSGAFIFDSTSVLESKDCSETSSSESLDLIRDSKNSMKPFENKYKLPKKLSKPSKSSSDLSRSSSESSSSSSESSTSSSESFASPKPSTSFYKPHKVSQIPFNSSSEAPSDTSSTSSSKSSSEDGGYPDQISKQQRRQRSKHSTGSAENILPTRELNRYKMQQSRHRSTRQTQENKPNHIHVNMSGNVNPNHSCSHSYMSEVSMPSQKGKMHEKVSSCYGNAYFCNAHCSQYMHSNCFQPSTHECHYNNATCQSKSCNNLYSIFQKQWENIHYSTYFQ